MLYWENKPNGTKPPTASGYYLGYYFEFSTTISSCKVEFAVSKLAKNASFTLREYKKWVKDAQSISKARVKWLIYKSCFKFLLNI